MSVDDYNLVVSILLEGRTDFTYSNCAAQSPQSLKSESLYLPYLKYSNSHGQTKLPIKRREGNTHWSIFWLKNEAKYNMKQIHKNWKKLIYKMNKTIGVEHDFIHKKNLHTNWIHSRLALKRKEEEDEQESTRQSHAALRVNAREVMCFTRKKKWCEIVLG